MKEHLQLKIEKIPTTSSISLGNQFALKKLPLLFRKLGKRTALITDDQVERLYSQELKKLNIPILTIASGEIHKTRSSKQHLEDQLLSHQFGRDSCLIGFGGGVVTDMVGFIAATYCRGIPYILVPTTFLAMVDASIGGKTGINSDRGKNLLGAFHFPKQVLIDLCFLQTLSHKQWLCGIAEVIKYALIRSKKLFTEMQKHSNKWQQKDPAFIKKILCEGIEIKTAIVREDPFEEKGKRRSLNFGHTIGHALEALEEFHISHGEAIAIGMIVESYLSMKFGYLNKVEFQQIQDLFNHYQFPLRLSRPYSFEQMMSVMSIDKKSHQAIPSFVLLKAIGAVHPFRGKYCLQVDPTHLREAIHFMNEEFVYD